MSYLVSLGQQKGRDEQGEGRVYLPGYRGTEAFERLQFSDGRAAMFR